MEASRIRSTFLEFFRARDHLVRPSASLIPHDPSLLLTVAGMVPFKPYFLGQARPERPRAASLQKCARTVDIDIVGTTTRHLTFFEMLGNFSFGDYFKAEAIRWAWELATTPQADGGYGFEPERIWATVYEQDEEAAALWRSETDINPAQVQRRGRADNFWSTGAAGPCGPCSELFYDRGPDHGPDGGPVVDESRFMEFWNLVFMQFEQDDAGTILGELPEQNVDTGMGFERMAMLLQDVPNVFETDVLKPILTEASAVTGVPYGCSEDSDVHLRVVAEHARSASFLIADGVLPSNEGRGYILRRLLRRAVRHTRLLGHDGPVMPAMTAVVRATLGQAWPELVAQAELVDRVAASEETGFARTLSHGMSLLDDAVADARSAGVGALPAATAFTLHDTYGFPVDLTVEIAREAGLDLDRDAFAEHMEAQRRRSRVAAGGGEGGVPESAYKAAAAAGGPTTFTGYSDTTAETALAALLGPQGQLERAEEGAEVEVVLPTTPFYAEGGGQLGDHGELATPTGRLEVLDTVAPLEGLTVHRARVVAGEVTVGQDVHAAIDTHRRASITRGHTATHILHATLKEVLGEHAMQAGSAIDAGRFRFDFPHFDSVGTDALVEVEGRVNERIAADPPIEVIETSQEQARALGAIALFGEQYGDRVRMVSIGGFSRELCGGTHVAHTPEVGLFTILSEGSIAANLRRIEALTGPDAFRYLSTERLVADAVARLLKVGTEEVVERVAALLERVRAAEKDVARLRREAVLAAADRLAAAAETVADGQVVSARVDAADRDGLKGLASDLVQRLGRSIVVLGSVTAEGSAQLVAAVSPDLAAEGLAASEVLRPAAEAVGGGAGGKGATAQAGGRDGGALDTALERARTEARDVLTARR